MHTEATGDEVIRRQVADEAVFLLTEAIRELLIPQHLDELFRRLHDQGNVSERYAAAVSHASMMSVVMALYRLWEVRQDFLLWLLSGEELQRLGFSTLDGLVRDWDAFMIVRSQYVGHARRKDPKGKRPGQIIPARKLGEALRETGMWESEDFLRRVRGELVPVVERVRDALLGKYPQAKEFIEVTYPRDLKMAAEGNGR